MALETKKRVEYKVIENGMLFAIFSGRLVWQCGAGFLPGRGFYFWVRYLDPSGTTATTLAHVAEGAER